eukprot:1154884-Pelagomonas_calceolata.AAC.4
MTGQHQCCCDCRRSEVSMLCCCGERRSKVSMLCCVADVAFCQAEMFRFEQLPLCFFLAALPNELAHAGRASMLSVCCESVRPLVWIEARTFLHELSKKGSLKAFLEDLRNSDRNSFP